MTPEEAVVEIANSGVLIRDDDSTRAWMLARLRAVKADETRRCAKLVRDCSVSWKSQKWTFELIADDILRTGGVEVEP